MNERRNPFVLGKPIKSPADFYGREHELRELFESLRNMQPVAIVGEHRCGNTSILYQMLDPTVRARYLDPPEDARLLFVFVNSQLAAEGPDVFYRRIARALKRADPDTQMSFEGAVDNFWIEDYLEGLVDRGRRLVLLLDEFEVLADFEAGFWEWFRGLITEYDVSIAVATRVELGDFRDEWGVGSPFFNMFRSVYIGAFSAGEAEAFLAGVSRTGGVDLAAAREGILALGGRFPYYLQVAAALYYELADREPLTGAPEQAAAVGREFTARTELHFEDIWTKLPPAEREALAWLAVATAPEPRDAMAFDQALHALERRGYLVEGRLFSIGFADYVQRQIQRIELNADTGEVRIERRAVDLPPKEFALLRLLLEKEGEVVTKDDIAAAVWPEYDLDTLGVTDAMIQKTISRLRKEIDAPGSEFQHIESVRGQGYRFQNASVFEVYHQGPPSAPNGQVAAP